MKNNLKKMAGYYKPYMGTFVLDMFFAFLASLISLVIPLVVRYITTNVTDMDTSFAVKQITIICGILVILVLIQFAANYFITNIGHVMGAKMEYDMRAEIFDHYQKLSFSFYDDQKVGQLMSRITSDLFEITELLHHGPENLAISSIKIIGAFIILSSISGYLTLAAFILLPFMFAYAYFMNKRMRKAFRENRVQIAEVNSRIEDNLSGIRVVKSFANEDIEKKKFKIGNDGFLRAKKESYFYMGFYHSGMTAFTMLINVVVIFIGGIFMAKGTVSAADFVTFLLYINVFTDPIRTLVDFAEQFYRPIKPFAFCEDRRAPESAMIYVKGKLYGRLVFNVRQLFIIKCLIEIIARFRNMRGLKFGICLYRINTDRYRYRNRLQSPPDILMRKINFCAGSNRGVFSIIDDVEGAKFLSGFIVVKTEKHFFKVGVIFQHLK